MAAYFADDGSKYISLNKNRCVLIQIPLNFIPKGPTDKNSAFV